jgi:hypothetical protein
MGGPQNAEVPVSSARAIYDGGWAIVSSARAIYDGGWAIGSLVSCGGETVG